MAEPSKGLSWKIDFFVEAHVGKPGRLSLEILTNEDTPADAPPEYQSKVLGVLLSAAMRILCTEARRRAPRLAGIELADIGRSLLKWTEQAESSDMEVDTRESKTSSLLRP